MPTPTPIPEGFHTVTPYLVVKGAAEAIAFYAKAFGAEEVERNTTEDGKIMNATLRIGDSLIMLNDEFPQFGAFGPTGEAAPPFSIHLYVEDVDASFERAVAAGAEPTMPVGDMFWGDRFGQLKDPFGHKWSIGTRIEELTRDEIAERAKHAFA